VESPIDLISPSGKELLAQVEKILASRSFSGSETVRLLLRYLITHAVEAPGQMPKEHEIAVTLLGRSTDFDPKLDPVVRVQASRLRSKLAEYYVAEGAADPVFVEVPKGSYCLHATYRGQFTAPAPAPSVPAADGRSRRLWIAGGIAALLVLGAAGIWQLAAPRPDDALRQFWRPFLKSSQEPLVIFANPKLVGTSSSALRMYDPAKDEGATVNQSYSGVGEVMGASELTLMFSRLGQRIRLKPSQLFSWDDANAYNLIFLGAPPHNVSLFRVPLGRKLKFKPYGEEPHKEQGCVHNLEPQGGEEEFSCTFYDGATFTEYALVTLSEGVNRSSSVLVVAGTTTLGTQAAIDFTCDPGRVSEIGRRLRVRRGDSLPPFDALIRCRSRSGAPVAADLVLVKR
jgi:hypothetical protein